MSGCEGRRDWGQTACDVMFRVTFVVVVHVLLQAANEEAREAVTRGKDTIRPG